MASTQEIHHLPVQGQDFNIQRGHFLQPTKPPMFTHKPHKKCVACVSVWKHKPLKKWSKHKLNKDESCSDKSDSCLGSSSESDSCLSSSSERDSCLGSSSERDSCLGSSSESDSSLGSSSESDSCLSSSSESDCGPETQPICKHKPPKECPVPTKCFESKHKLKKGKGKFVPEEKPKLDWKHKSKHFECEQQCTASLECKFKPKKNGFCTGDIQDCLVFDGPSCPTFSHCGGNHQKMFDCDHNHDRFRRCLVCKSNLACECLEHSHFGLCALKNFLIRRCSLFGCHKQSPKPWPKLGAK